MITLKQKDIRELVRNGHAIDVTTATEEQARELWEHDLERIACSYGLNGINGALYIDTADRCLYAVTARTTMLFYLG